MNGRRILIIAFTMLGVVSASAMGIMVPAYFDPSSSPEYWASLDYAAARAPLVAIMNPNNGPGTSQDSTYVSALASLHAAGGTIIGYVDSKNTKRSLATVESNIDTYISFYAIDGFFIDDMTDDANTSPLDYYASVYQYIKAKGTNYSVTGNPGDPSVPDYLTQPAADRLMVFEDDGTNYPGYAPSTWVTNFPASDFIHVAYNVASAATMSNYVALAASRHAGWVYITDDVLNNPYDTLPAYWTNEVKLVQSLNGVKLSVTASGGSVSISWPGAGTLQASGTLGSGAGWSNVSAISPYSVTVTNMRQFFRVVQ